LANSDEVVETVLEDLEGVKVVKEDSYILPNSLLHLVEEVLVLVELVVAELVMEDMVVKVVVALEVVKEAAGWEVEAKVKPYHFHGFQNKHTDRIQD
jgi:hypothetical protein